MKALITGASSGIGRDMARCLSRRGADLVLVARRVDRLERLKAELDTDVQIMGADLSQSQICFDLYDQLKGQGVDIVINNAGFGLFGAFDQTDLERELEMIDTNIRAVHILTKLFLRDFVKQDRGYLLNVASSAAFLPGPLLSTYYASKSYVLRLTEAVYEELRRRGSHVGISVLCPGPVQTEFNDVADCRFSVKGLSSQRVAEYAVRKMLHKDLVIVPGGLMKATQFAERFFSEKMLLRMCYHMQKRKLRP